MLGTGQVGRIAQCEQQGRVGIEPVADGLAIDGHAGHERDATIGGGACKAPMGI